MSEANRKRMYEFLVESKRSIPDVLKQEFAKDSLLSVGSPSPGQGTPPGQDKNKKRSKDGG